MKLISLQTFFQAVFRATFWATALTGFLPLAVPGAFAIERSNGTFFFDKPPRLLDAYTTFNDTHVWGATYYFTVELPENAGEPLQRIVLEQTQGLENIRFRLNKTEAFTGTPRHPQQKLSLAAVTQDEKSQTVIVTFDPPVPPGNSITVGLQPVRNPMSSGVYLFGVTVFPRGEESEGLRLGVGRLHFYSIWD